MFCFCRCFPFWGRALSRESGLSVVSVRRSVQLLVGCGRLRIGFGASLVLDSGRVTRQAQDMTDEEHSRERRAMDSSADTTPPINPIQPGTVRPPAPFPSDASVGEVRHASASRVCDFARLSSESVYEIDTCRHEHDMRVSRRVVVLIGSKVLY